LRFRAGVLERERLARTPPPYLSPGLLGRIRDRERDLFVDMVDTELDDNERERDGSLGRDERPLSSVSIGRFP
jgi:hypothetical protein